MSLFRLIAIATSLVVSIFASSGIAHAAPVEYTIGTKLSRVTFGIGHQGFIESFGTLNISPATLKFDNDDWSNSSVAVTMLTKTLDMGDSLWNKQIRGDESWTKLFANPTISFKSMRIERVDNTNGTLIGDLTLAGVTKSVSLKLHVNKIGLNDVSEKPSVGFTATGTVKRSEFGLNAYEDLVGDELSVKVQIEASVGGD